MAAFGLKYLRFAPNKAVAEDGTITYDAPVTIGEAVKADLTITYSNGKVYGDDALSEAIESFVSGSIAMETVDMTDDVASIIFGATIEGDECTYNINDNPPEGGLAYYKTLLRGNKKLFKGYFYPRTKAMRGNDTASTKGESITFSNVATTWTVMAPLKGDWNKTNEFDTEAAVRAWIEEKLGAAKEGV